MAYERLGGGCRIVDKANKTGVGICRSVAKGRPPPEKCDRNDTNCLENEYCYYYIFKFLIYFKHLIFFHRLRDCIQQAIRMQKVALEGVCGTMLR